MGPSGAGRSTLINILATLDVPTRGKVLINGKNVMGMNDTDLSEFRRENIGFIFQDFNLLDTLTIKDNATILIVTHDAVIGSYCKELLMIRDGKIDAKLTRGGISQFEFYQEVIKETSRECEELFINDEIEVNYEYNI